MNQAFRENWLNRFGLPQKGWRKEARRRLRDLPFAEPKACGKLLVALFETVPERLEEDPDSETARIAEGFGWCCFSFWQCGSAFPAYPEDYAGFLLAQLLHPGAGPRRDAAVMARMIDGVEAESGRCGFNALQLRDPETIRESERYVLGGEYDLYLRAGEKYREYVKKLRTSAEFRRDWSALKTTFPQKVGGRPILHRSLIPERNWFQDGTAAFTTRASRFQAAFDLFCWKYFLWGMREDTPLLLKPSVVFTPLGTQIFVPGYLSFDPKRDFDLRRISRLHKARGIIRQGEKMSSGREELALRTRRARELDREAKARGLKSERRYQFIATGLGMCVCDDFRQVRSLLRNGQTLYQSKSQ